MMRKHSHCVEGARTDFGSCCCPKRRATINGGGDFASRLGMMKIMAVGISQNFSCEMNSFLTTHCEWVNGFLNRCFLC